MKFYHRDYQLTASEIVTCICVKDPVERKLVYVRGRENVRRDAAARLVGQLNQVTKTLEIA